MARRTGSSWNEEAQLEHGYSSTFGATLVVDGNRLFVGDTHDTMSVGVAGGAFVYQHSGSAWELDNVISIEDRTTSVTPVLVSMAAQDGLAVLVTRITGHCGPAYVFREHALRNGGRRWLQEAKLDLPDDECLSGVDVAVDGNHILITTGVVNNVHLFVQRRVVGAPASVWDELATLPGQAPAIIDDGRIVTRGAPDLQIDPTTTLFTVHYLNSAGICKRVQPPIRVPVSPQQPVVLAFAHDTLLVGDSNHTEGSSTPGAVYAYDLVRDCNSNGVPDSCDIAGQASTDCNSNGLPDECESPCAALGIGVADGARLAGLFEACQTVPCTAPPCEPPLYAGGCCTLLDADHDGDVDLSDYATQQTCVSPPVALDCNTNSVPDYLEGVPGDFNGDGATTPADFAMFQGCLSPTCDFATCAPVYYGDACCLLGDADGDGDVDLRDFAAFQHLAPTN
ncbi:MAG: hypothetical protein H6816_11010 [Phycisphaerales bacterium]|nr:hypothetical protein [Phycisphaerales bacterium]